MSRIEELEKRLGADPNSRIFVQLAEEYRKAGLLEQAIEVCENGLKKHPQYPSARVALGRALLEAASFDRASTEFETVLQQVPDNILANKFLGETYEKLGRLEEALQKYEIAHTLAPEDPDLEERINGVEKVLRDGPAAAAAPAPAPPPTPPAQAAATPPVPSPPPAPPTPPTPPPPPAPTNVAPAPPSEELEPTLFDGPAPGSPEASPPPPPEPEARSFDDDLAPIPLVEVDGPMELEDRFAAPPTETPSAPPEPPAPPPQHAQPPTPPPPAPEPEQFFEAEPEQAFEAFTPGPTPPPQEPAPPAPPTPTRTPTPTPTPPAPAQAAPPPPSPPSPPSPQSQPKKAPPPSAPAPAAPSGSSPGTGQVETRTMAELYASQGHLDQAIEVYRKLLEKNPDSMEYRTRLDELTMLLQATQVKTPPPPQRPGRDELSVDGSAADERDRKAIQKLEGWLDGIRKSKDAE